MSDELVVGAALNDVALVHDNDFVGMTYRGQPVGDDNAGATLHELVKGVLYGLFALGVECAGSLVEDEDGRIFQYRTGDAEALALSTAEVESAVTDGGVVPLL